MTNLLLIAMGYLLGSIPFGVILTRLFGAGDLRQIGSGNIGATNVLRTGRKGLAAATLILDGTKGAVAVVLARHFVPELGDQAQLVTGAGEHLAVDPVGDCGHEDVGRLDGGDKFLVSESVVVLVQACVEQFLHAQLDGGGQLPGYDDLQFLGWHLAPS